MVVYDNSDVFSAYRVYWTFRVFGHETVSVMNGGLSKWLAEKLPVSTISDTQFEVEPKVYKASIDKSLVCDYQQIVQYINGQTKGSIFDARSKPRYVSPVWWCSKLFEYYRFDGTAPEPRPGLPSGHMPTAHNLPFNQLFAKDKTLLKPDELLEKFIESGLDLKAFERENQDLVFSCGSGVTASVLYFAAEQLISSGKIGNGNASKELKSKLKLYDGSWSQYASLPESKIETTKNAKQ